MNCPNCKTPYDSREGILHCKNCGCSFIPQNYLSKVSVKKAEQFNDSRASDYIYTTQKLCPLDKVSMRHVTDKDSCDYYVCDTCNGRFFFPSDLVKYVKNKSIIYEYFHLMHITLPKQAIQSLALAVLVIVGIIAFQFSTTRPTTTTTSASSALEAVTITQQNNDVTLAFTTNRFVQSHIIVYTADQHTVFIEEDVSRFFARQHTVTIHNLGVQTYYYELVLTDPEQKVVKTPLQKLK